jgi:hypothetical protein
VRSKSESLRRDHVRIDRMLDESTPDYAGARNVDFDLNPFAAQTGFAVP